jgi:hypothetical protein
VEGLDVPMPGVGPGRGYFESHSGKTTTEENASILWTVLAESRQALLLAPDQRLSLESNISATPNSSEVENQDWHQVFRGEDLNLGRSESGIHVLCS